MAGIVLKRPAIVSIQPRIDIGEQAMTRAIRDAVAAMEMYNGSAYITAPLLAKVRDKGHELAVAAGVPIATALLVDDKDLASLYAVARKAPASAAMIAGKLIRKYAPGGLPAAAPTGPTAAFDLEAARALVAEALGPMRTELADDCRAALDGVRATSAETFETLEKLVLDTINTAIQGRVPTELVVTMPDAAPVPLGTVHYKTADIVRAVSAGLNVYLHGPAGSGKTTVARKVAEALGVPFYFAAKVESEYLLLGFRDARGKAVRTAFREAYENGGLFLFDELDASSPGAIVALNAALANGICAFPDGIVFKHDNFRCIAAGNTALTGATRQYTGRSQMDAASIDRFAFIEFGYDEALEMEISGNKSWCAHVQAIRAAVAERSMNWLVTPRASIDGSISLAAGFTWEAAEMMHVFKGLDADTVDQLRRAVGKANPLLGMAA